MNSHKNRKTWTSRPLFNRQSAVILTLVLMMLAAVTAKAGEDKKEKWSMASRLYSDMTARKVGDLITVIIEEESKATKAAKSSSSKKVSRSGQTHFGHPTLDSLPTSWTNAVMPAWSLEADRSFEGGGSLENNETLTFTMTAMVKEVLPNGNLLIEGKRSVVIQDERVVFIMTGTVRPADISRDNTIKSSLIADASIRYASSGPMVKNQKRGLITALWNWLNPF